MKPTDAEKIAKALNTSVDTLRLGLIQNKFPFGAAIECNKQYAYVWYPPLVKEYTGVDLTKED